MRSQKVFKACKKCSDERYPGCHDHCKRYKDERAEYDRLCAIADKDKSVKAYIYEEHNKHADRKAQEKKIKAGYKHL